MKIPVLLVRLHGKKNEKVKSCKSADKMYLQFEVVPALKW